MHGPALVGANGVGIGLRRMGGAAIFKTLVVLLVGVSTGGQRGRLNVLAVVTSVHKTLHTLPVAATVQGSSIPSVPVITHPPAVDIVGIRAVAMAALVLLVGIGHVAVLEVLVVIEGVVPVVLCVWVYVYCVCVCVLCS